MQDLPEDAVSDLRFSAFGAALIYSVLCCSPGTRLRNSSDTGLEGDVRGTSVDIIHHQASYTSIVDPPVSSTYSG